MIVLALLLAWWIVYDVGQQVAQESRQGVRNGRTHAREWASTKWQAAPAPVRKAAGGVAATGRAVVRGAKRSGRTVAAGYHRGVVDGRDAHARYLARKAEKKAGREETRPMGRMTPDGPHFGTRENDPNGVRDCRYCAGTGVIGGKQCPSCLARQEARNRWWSENGRDITPEPTDPVAEPKENTMTSAYRPPAIDSFLDGFNGHNGTVPTAATIDGGCNIGQTRDALQGMVGRAAARLDRATSDEHEARDIATAAERLAADLTAQNMDPQTLADISLVLDFAQQAQQAAQADRSVAEQLGAAAQAALNGLNARHGLMEEAVNNTQHAAQTDYYKAS